MAEKSIHTIVLDAGPIIRGQPSVSSLLQQCESLVSSNAIISEIRDEAARSRLQTTLLPFLALKNPNPNSIKIITDFARKTGDLSVLSRTDIEILALAYELECERNGGDWRLRRTPGQRRTNGPPPGKSSASLDSATPRSLGVDERNSEERIEHENAPYGLQSVPRDEELAKTGQVKSDPKTVNQPEEDPSESSVTSGCPTAPGPLRIDERAGNNSDNHLDDTLVQQFADTSVSDPDKQSEDSDSEGWITPSNIKRHQEQETATELINTASEPKIMQVATITTDFAMQNVLLQMNLNLLSPSLQRVRNIKTFVLRCHACFSVSKDMSKQFCAKCGQPTLTRISCTTNQQTGEFKLHLKKNMQWNNRGNVYSIPKPVSGAANGRVKGGGKDGWGQGLILVEDQKEYIKAVQGEKRMKSRDLMDKDYLPGILSGERGMAGGRPKIGAGRNINSRKR